jgi:DNA invertase Pin-like site-specific DNA recombinase
MFRVAKIWLYLGMGKKYHDEDDEDEKPENWPAIRDLFAQVIQPAKDWTDADIIESVSGMAEKFSNSFPGVAYTFDDLKLALFDMNVSFERNEHNNKFYYLAKWR